MSDDADDVEAFYDDCGERLGLTDDYEHLEPVLPDLSDQRVLDAGCGLGDGSEYLASRGATVTGVDVSGEEIGTARERHGTSQSLEFYRADLREPLDRFDDGEFDVVVCALTLGHLEDWDRPFEEFGRVLGGSGSVVAHCHHPFVDYLELEAGDPETVVGTGATYSETERFERPWGPDGERMPFYRRPLGELFRPGLRAGFALEQFVEPGAGPHESDRYDPEDPPRHLLLRFRK